MALHEIPADGAKHLASRDCPCGPKSRKRMIKGIRRTVYAHQEWPTTADVMLSDRVSVPAGTAGRVAPAANPEAGPEAACGHVVVETDTGWQHHDIPDDGSPHAATTECGCGPQLDQSSGHTVLLHVDQGDDVDDLYREVFGA